MPVASSASREKPPARVHYVRPWLYERQRDAIFGGERFAVIEASTKSGKTVGCMTWLYEQAVTAKKPGQNYWWIAPILAQAKIAYRRYKRFLPEDSFETNDTEVTITLKHNGATLWFKGSDNPDTLYGEDVYAAVIDEGSRCKEGTWQAVRTTLTATQGRCRVIGNVKGRQNWAFRLARRAEEGRPGWTYHKLTAYDAVEGGVMPAGEPEAAREDIPEADWRELYLAEPTEEGANPFGLEKLRACRVPTLAAGPAVAWGVDLASRVDWLVIIGLNRHGEVCAFDRWQKPWDESMELLRAMIGNTPTLVDQTGLGDPVVRLLQAHREYTEHAVTRAGHTTQRVVTSLGRPNIEGYVLSLESKQALFERLAVAFHQQRTRYPETLPPPHGRVLANELDAFEYTHTSGGKIRYSAPEGMHDDCVVAYALAVWKLATARVLAPPIVATGVVGW